MAWQVNRRKLTALTRPACPPEPQGVLVDGDGSVVILSHRINESNGFGNLTPPPNRQLVVLISKNTQYLNDFVWESTF